MPEYDDATMLAQAERAARFLYQRADGRIGHAERTVALIPEGHGVLCEATAWLHHAGDDVPGMHPAIEGAVRALRPRPGQAPSDHFRRIADNAIATCVFRAHLLDNFLRTVEGLNSTTRGTAEHAIYSRALDQYLVADNWFARHVVGYHPVVNESAARAAGGDGTDYAYPHVATMPREVLDKLDALALDAGMTTAVAGPLRDDIVKATRRAIDEALAVVSTQTREDLRGLTDEVTEVPGKDREYVEGYRDAMIDAAQLRSLS